MKYFFYKTAWILGLISLVTFGTGNYLWAEDVVITTDDSNLVVGNYAGLSCAQSFTATVTGTIKSIGVVWGGPLSGETFDTTLKIYEGDGVNGELLYTKENISLRNTYTSKDDYTYNTIDIDGTVNITNGSMYTFLLFDHAPGRFCLLTSGYSDGSLWFSYQPVAEGLTKTTYALPFKLVQQTGGSPSAPSATVTLSSNLQCDQLTLESETGLVVGNNTLINTGAANISGNLTIARGNIDTNGTFNATGGSINFTDAGSLNLGGAVISLGTFAAANGTVIYDQAGDQTIANATYYNLTLAGNGTKTSGGALDINNNLTISSGATFALAHDINVAGDWLNSGSFTANNYKLNLDGADQQLLGSNTFYELSKEITTAASLSFEANKTTTVNGTLTLKGAAGQPLSLRSTVNGTQWKIDPQGSRDIAYLDVQDSNNISGTIINTNDKNCTDSGNNENWFNAPPVITTQNATSIGMNYATGHGNITSLGSPYPTAYGVCWSTSANATTNNTCSDEGAANATGAFTSNITNLSPGITYHYRAYATNEEGTVYGEDITFTTVTGYYFHSTASGNWSNSTTWQQSTNDSDWVNATSTPNSTSKGTVISSGNTVTVDTDVSVEHTIVEDNAVLAVNNSTSLTVNEDLTVNGTLSSAENGTVIFAGSSDSILSGSGQIDFSTLILNKDSSDLKLDINTSVDVSISKALLVTQGTVDLSGWPHNLLLGGALEIDTNGRWTKHGNNAYALQFTGEACTLSDNSTDGPQNLGHIKLEAIQED